VLKLGILTYELEHVAVTDKEKADALGAVERMRTVIEERKPNPAPPGGMTGSPQADEYHR
jgi:hypothetical protein